MSAQTLSTRRHFVKIVGTVGATAAVGPFFHARPAKADKGELVVVSWGGSWAKSLREVMFTPFEKETGYKVRDDGPPEAVKLKAMAQSGSVTWDILDTDMPALQTMVKEGLLDPIDYSKIDKAKLNNIPKTLQSSHAMKPLSFSRPICTTARLRPMVARMPKLR